MAEALGVNPDQLTQEGLHFAQNFHAHSHPQMPLNGIFLNTNAIEYLEKLLAAKDEIISTQRALIEDLRRRLEQVPFP